MASKCTQNTHLLGWKSIELLLESGQKLVFELDERGLLKKRPKREPYRRDISAKMAHRKNCESRKNKQCQRKFELESTSIIPTCCNTDGLSEIDPFNIDNEEFEKDKRE